MEDSIRQRIKDDITQNKIFLYMKGSPDAPQCGFSAQAVAVLQSYNQTFGSFDVLSDNDIRNGIKEYSDWPTIPQLYVNGEFIGGCDIITQMHQNGELKNVISE